MQEKYLLIVCLESCDQGGEILKSEELAEKLATLLKERSYMFSELLREFHQVDYRTFLLGWSELRTQYQLDRDEEGRYLLKA